MGQHLSTLELDYGDIIEPAIVYKIINTYSVKHIPQRKEDWTPGIIDLVTRELIVKLSYSDPLMIKRLRRFKNFLLSIGLVEGRMVALSNLLAHAEKGLGYKHRFYWVISCIRRWFAASLVIMEKEKAKNPEAIMHIHPSYSVFPTWLLTMDEDGLEVAHMNDELLAGLEKRLVYKMPVDAAIELFTLFSKRIDDYPFPSTVQTFLNELVLGGFESMHNYKFNWPEWPES